LGRKKFENSKKIGLWKLLGKFRETLCRETLFFPEKRRLIWNT
jgi:hypothetical protein